MSDWLPPGLERYLAEVVPPEREMMVLHACMCALTNHAGTVTDRCCAWVENPDSPLCNMCVSSGHDDLPHVPYSDVVRERARPGEGKGP